MSCARAHLAAVGYNGQEIARAHLAAIGCNGLTVGAVIILRLEGGSIGPRTESLGN